jgi:hypothetical protein
MELIVDIYFGQKYAFFENFRRCAIFDARVADFQPAGMAFKTLGCDLYDDKETVKMTPKKKRHLGYVPNISLFWPIMTYFWPFYLAKLPILGLQSSLYQRTHDCLTYIIN